MRNFSFSRLWTIMFKEFVLMKRDPAVVVIMAVLPLIIVCLAGYAINTNTKHVPTVLINFDNTPITHELIYEMKNTEYFSFMAETKNNDDAYHLLKTGKALLAMTIPLDFTKSFLRNEK